MEWLINRRRMMFNKAVPPAYLTFEDPEVWRIICDKYGDYNEIAITDNGNNTVNITTTLVQTKNGSVVKRTVINTQENINNTGGEYTIGTLKELVGITRKQCSAVTSFPSQLFASNTLITSFNELKYFTKVHELSYRCFDGCTNLKDIDMINVTKLGQLVFRNTPNTIFHNIGNIASFGTDCFYNSGLSYIDLSYLSTIPNVYNDCKKLTTVVISSNITELKASFFNECISLENININDNITYFNNLLFNSCNKLKLNKLPDSLTYLGERCFGNCSSLMYIGAMNTNLSTYGRDMVRKAAITPELIGVTLPSTVTSVGLGNYGYTPSFLRCYAITPPTATNTVVGNNSYIFANIYVPDSVVNDYKTASVWSTYADRIYPMSQWAADAQTNGWQDVQTGLVWDREEE